MLPYNLHVLSCYNNYITLQIEIRPNFKWPNSCFVATSLQPLLSPRSTGAGPVIVALNYTDLCYTHCTAPHLSICLSRFSIILPVIIIIIIIMIILYVCYVMLQLHVLSCYNNYMTFIHKH